MIVDDAFVFKELKVLIGGYAIIERKNGRIRTNFGHYFPKYKTQWQVNPRYFFDKSYFSKCLFHEFTHFLGIKNHCKNKKCLMYKDISTFNLCPGCQTRIENALSKEKTIGYIKLDRMIKEKKLPEIREFM